MRRIQLFVNIEPIPDRQPARHRHSEQQRRDWKINIELEIENALEVQQDSRLIRRDKCQANKNGVEERKNRFDSSEVPAVHAKVRITWAKPFVWNYIPDANWFAISCPMASDAVAPGL